MTGEAIGRHIQNTVVNRDRRRIGKQGRPRPGVSLIDGPRVGLMQVADRGEVIGPLATPARQSGAPGASDDERDREDRARVLKERPTRENPVDLVRLHLAHLSP